MRLSILICTLPERQHKLNLLLNSLELQRTGEVEIITNNADRSLPTGTKRNQLISASQGEYFCFIDDDDRVPSYYISEMLHALTQNPDVVTFIGYITNNGKDQRNFTIKLGSPYEEKNGHYYRFPNHLCCFKKSLVQHVKFDSIWLQEDYRWAKKIHDSRILKTEVHINKNMYHYDCWPKPVNRMRR